MEVRPGSDERGSIIVIVLAFTAALFVLGSALLVITLGECVIAYNQERDARLYYITEAGIEAGVAALSRCPDFEGPLVGGLGGGTYHVQIVDAPGLEEGQTYQEQLPLRLAAGERMLISTGSLEGASLVMAVIVECGGAPPAGIFPGLPDECFTEPGLEGVMITEWIKMWRL